MSLERNVSCGKSIPQTRDPKRESKFPKHCQQVVAVSLRAPEPGRSFLTIVSHYEIVCERMCFGSSLIVGPL